jgi:hypothetical protein
VIPSSETLQLSNQAVRLCLRQACGMIPEPDIPARCVCVDQLTPDHFLTCKRFGGLIHNHNAVNQAIANILSKGHLAAQVEVSTGICKATSTSYCQTLVLIGAQ